MKYFFLLTLIFCSINLLQCAGIELTREQQEQERVQAETKTQKKILAEEPLTTPLPFATNGLFVFLDYGAEIGTLTSSEVVTVKLLEALNQIAGCIVASTGLLKNILTAPSLKELAQQFRNQKGIFFEQFTALYQGQDPQEIAARFEIIDEILQDVQKTIQASDSNSLAENLQQLNKRTDQYKNLITNNDRLFLPIMRALRKQLSQFNPHEWTIKKIDQHHILLIPKNYNGLVRNQNSFADHYKKNKFSTDELNLGIKIEAMETIDSLNDFLQSYQYPLQSTPRQNFVDLFPTIFITRSEYQKEKIDNKLEITHMPQWFLYMHGHGISSIIAQIPLAQFKKLLQDLEQKITTKLLIYDSCYAAGTNANSLYQELNNPIYKSFSFVIVSTALTDAPTFSSVFVYRLFDISVDTIDLEKKYLKPITHFNCRKFTETITTVETPDFPALLENIVMGATNRADERIIFSLPQIKMPGIPWFKVLDTHEKIVSIGNILAFARSPDKPLDIMKFFNRKKPLLGILLYANIIPFPLLISTQTMPLMISMIPGAAVHKIKKVVFDGTLKDFVRPFALLRNQNIDKFFWLSELEVQEQNNIRNYENVIIKVTHNPDRVESSIAIYYTRNSFPYFWSFDSEQGIMFPDGYDAILSSLQETFSLFAQDSAKAEQKMKEAELIREAQEKKIKKIEAKKAKE